MRTRITYRLALLILCSACIAAGMPPQGRPAQSYALPPGDYRPVDLAVCATGDAILFASASGDPLQRTYYILHTRDGSVKEILKAGLGSISASPVGHEFMLAVRSGDAYQIIIVDDQGTLGGLMNHSQRMWDPQWSSDGREVAMRSYAEGGAQPSEPWFTALAIYEVYTQRFRTFNVDPPGQTLRVSSSGYFVFPSTDPKAAGAGARIYNVNGDISSQRPGVKGTTTSATGAYYLTPVSSPGAPFAVHDMTMNQLVRKFNEPGGKSPDAITYLRWHPKNDKWLAVWRDATDGSRALEVVDAENGKTVKTFTRWDRKQGDVPWGFSRDGVYVVFFRDGKFIYEPIKP